MSLYKTKNGPIGPRPQQIGNTFVGTQTDLTQYGYYTVINDPPQPPTGQRYVDSGKGEYNDNTMEYMADWVLEDIPIPPPVYEPMTHLQFIDRFTLEEQAAFETLLADCRNGTSQLDATNRGMVLVMGRQFEAARDVRLDNQSTINFIQALVSLTILTPERATEILTP